MKKYFYILLIPFLLVIGSCKKELISTRIEGQLLGLTEGKPIADADVYISKSKELPLGGGTIITSAGQTKTDNEGKFEFKIRQEKGWIYKVFARKKEYFDEETTRGVQSFFYLKSLSVLSKTRVSIFLKEPAYINLIAKNTSNFDQTNRIGFDNIISGNEILGFNCSDKELKFNRLIIPSNTDISENYEIMDAQVNLIKKGIFNISAKQTFSSTDLYFEY
jgi:hypothetical protein